MGSFYEKYWLCTLTVINNALWVANSFYPFIEKAVKKIVWWLEMFFESAICNLHNKPTAISHAMHLSLEKIIVNYQKDWCALFYTWHTSGLRKDNLNNLILPSMLRCMYNWNGCLKHIYSFSFYVRNALRNYVIYAFYQMYQSKIFCCISRKKFVCLHLKLCI